MDAQENLKLVVEKLPLTQFEKNSILRLSSDIWQEGFQRGQKVVVDTQDVISQLLGRRF